LAQEFRPSPFGAANLHGRRMLSGAKPTVAYVIALQDCCCHLLFCGIARLEVLRLRFWAPHLRAGSGDLKNDSKSNVDIPEFD
jgi:hypothetical protein